MIVRTLACPCPHASWLVDGQDHEARSRVIATVEEIVAELLTSLPAEVPSVADTAAAAQYRVMRWLWLAEDLYIAQRLLATPEAVRAGETTVELSVSAVAGIAARRQTLERCLALVLEPTTLTVAQRSVVRVTVTFTEGV